MQSTRSPQILADDGTFSSDDASGVITNMHESKSQEIQAAPPVGIVRLFVMFREANSPDPVDRTGLYQHLRAGLPEEPAQLGVLGKLCLVGAPDNREPAFEPGFLVEATHFATERLRSPWIGGLEHQISYRQVAEQCRLLGHHEMLGRWITLTPHDKWSDVPLTEATGSHSIPAGPMPPREQEIQFLACVETNPECLEVLSVGHC